MSKKYQELEVGDYLLKLYRGSALPLGANFIEDGVNFSVISSRAQKVNLLIFESNNEEPLIEIELEENYNKTGDVYHILIKGLPQYFKYGYRVFGEYNPEKGLFYDSSKILSDPYSLALSGSAVWGEKFKRAKGEYFGYQRRSFVLKSNFDWEDDKPINYPLYETIIYEMHVRGFTKHESSGVEHKGTFLGIVEKIPYLKELGITSIELLPIQEFDEMENINRNPKTQTRLYNYWGYSTISFFAPKASYSSSGKVAGQVDEFKYMVRELHKAGIEVILDIVFNHTGEGNQYGPIYSFKGFDALTYYMIAENGDFMNYSGCGNTFNCNHPVVRNFIIDVLRYWVTEMHVDGFRFDLASILGRDPEGNVLNNPPVVEAISKDPVLSKTKIIAEAWDAGGLYQVGSFPGERWAEWNGRFRDDIRRVVKGEEGLIGGLIERFIGSPDLYETSKRAPFHSINFVTSHDGFTMYDLVSYNNKHNEDNGEDNRDGDNNNNSYNYGVEGDTDDHKILRIRRKQIKNFFAILLLSQGTPMLLAGDEFLRTQKGNNNAYCQDNDISWIDWSLLDKNRDIFEYVKKLIKFRRSTKLFRIDSFDDFEDNIKITYHGVKPNKPDLDYYSKTVGIMIENIGFRDISTIKRVYFAFNMWEKPIGYNLPIGDWKLKLDTEREDSFFDEPISIRHDYLILHPHSIVALIEE